MNLRPAINIKVLIPLVVAVVFFGAGLCNSQLGTEVDLSGNVVKLNNAWGIEADWDPLCPFAIRTFTVVNWPVELQQDQGEIRGLFAVKTVAKGKWGVIISPISL